MMPFIKGLTCFELAMSFLFSKFSGNMIGNIEISLNLSFKVTLFSSDKLLNWICYKKLSIFIIINRDNTLKFIHMKIKMVIFPKIHLIA